VAHLFFEQNIMNISLMRRTIIKVQSLQEW